MMATEMVRLLQLKDRAHTHSLQIAAILIPRGLEIHIRIIIMTSRAKI